MWTAAPAAVFVIVTILLLGACLVSTYQVGKRQGRWRITVKVLGLGFTVEYEHGENIVGRESSERQGNTTVLHLDQSGS